MSEDRHKSAATICREFVAALSSDPTVSLGDFLGHSAEGSDELFRCLLVIELVHRRERGDELAEAEYQGRFPDRTAVISAVFANLTALWAAKPVPWESTIDFAVAPTEGRQAVQPTLSFSSKESATTRKRVGDYELLKEIARGGMGVVFKARQVSLNRIVALKMIRAGQAASQEELSRFQLEAAAAAQLEHPHIVPVYEAGWEDDCPYMAMGFVEGESLERKLQNGPWPPRQAVELMIPVVRAVHFAHERGIVHRDLKPGNILIDQQDQPKVVDFGLAKWSATDSDLTATGQIMGTPNFMPPEQASGKIHEIGPAADVYSLGATLYCAVTGRPPFQAASTMETLQQVLTHLPVSPRLLNGSVDRDLETICLKCLEKEPERRYASASELADDLERYSAGQPIVARPIGTMAKAVRWCRRNRAVTAMILLVVALLIGSGWFYASWLSYRAHLTEMQTQAAIADANQKAALEKADAQRFFAALQTIISRRIDAPLGWTWQNLSLLSESAALAPNPQNEVDLRSEFAAAQFARDLRLVEQLFPFRPRCVAFDEQGTRLAFGEFKAQAYVTPCRLAILDLQTRNQQVVRIPSALVKAGSRGLLPNYVQDGVRSLAWHPSGQWLFVGMRSGNVFAVNMNDLGEKPRSWKASDKAIFAMACSDQLYTIDDDDVIKRWELRLAAEESFAEETAQGEAGGSIEGLALASGGRLLVAGDGDAIWDSQTLALIRPLEEDWSWPVFGPKDHWVAGLRDERLVFIDPATGKERSQISLSDGLADPFVRLTMSRDGSLAVLRRDGQNRQDLAYLEVWDLVTPRRIATINADEYADPVIGPRGRFLATPSRHGLLLYEVRGAAADSVQQTVGFHSEPLQAMTCAPELPVLATASWAADVDLAVQIHPLDNADAPGVSLMYEAINHTDPIQLCFHPRDPLLAVCQTWTDDSRIAVWRTDKLEKTDFRFRGAPRRVAFSAADHRLWIADGQGESHELKSVELDGRIATKWANWGATILHGDSTITCLAAGNQVLLAGTPYGETMVFSMESGEPVDNWNIGDRFVSAVAIDPSRDRWFAAGTLAGELFVRPASSSSDSQQFAGHHTSITTMVFDQRSRLLASGCRDGSIRIWCRDGSTFELLLGWRLEGVIQELAFTHDNRLAVLVSGEHAVRVFDLAQVQQEIRRVGIPSPEW